MERTDYNILGERGTGLVLGISLGCLVAMAYLARHYVMDDAYIGFRYVDNLLCGNGLVFNPHDRVEGVTNIGWLLFLAPFSLLAQITVVAKVLGLVLAAATTILGFSIARQLSEEGPAGLYALPIPLFIATYFDFTYFSMAGMETALLSTLFCIVVYLALIDKYLAVSSFLCAIAFLVHPESVLVFPLFVALRLAARGGQGEKLLAPIFVFIVSIAFFTLLRYSYYSDVLPNTYHAKPVEFNDLLRSAYAYMKGANKNFSFPFNTLAVFIFFLFGCLSSFKKFPKATTFMVSIVAVGIIFSVYARQDWTRTGRYFAPYAPVAFILAWRGLVDIHEKLFERVGGKKKPATLIALYALVIVALGFVDTYYHLSEKRTERYPGFVLTSKHLKGPSLWMGENLADDCTIATRRIGAVSYYSKKKILDYKFGLVDKEITGLKKLHHRQFNLPTDPALGEVWRREAPEYFLEDSPAIEHIVKETGGSMQGFEIHGITYRAIKRFRIAKDIDWVLCEKKH